MTRRVERLGRIAPQARARILGGPRDAATHAALLAESDVFACVEQRAPPQPVRAGPTLRIAAWNAERCAFAAGSAALLQRTRIDVALLTEMDLGMARTGNRHTIAALAEATGQGYVFGVEYVELGLGDARESAEFAGEENAAGLHGNGILSRFAMERAAILRFDTGGRWFAPESREPRLGGRTAVAVTIALAETRVAFVTVHFDSGTDPIDRRRQMERLLDAVDDYAGEGPTLLGGDLNTNTIAGGNTPTDPGTTEPLFAAAAAHGFSHTDCNAPQPTTRPPRHAPVRPWRRKLDWFLTRGLTARDAAVVAATDEAGDALSDHELIAVTVTARH